MVSVIKGSTALCLHLGVAFGVTYAMTGSLVAGGITALVEACINVLASHCHEKIWERCQNHAAPAALASSG